MSNYINAFESIIKPRNTNNVASLRAACSSRMTKVAHGGPQAPRPR